MTIDNILTIDLEDWFHICGIRHIIPEALWPHMEDRVVENTLKILDILKRKGVKATFFVLGFIAERHPDLIKEIQSKGHEIASHGYSHRRVYTMSPHAFRKDLRKASDMILGITGLKVRGYRAPEWSIRDDSLWALDILKEEGFEYDSSMAPLPIVGNPHYAKSPKVLSLDGGPLWEFPPLVCPTPFFNLPIGGGWGLRVFPYSLIRSIIKRMNRKGFPAVIHVHPREFDRENPRITLPWTKRFVLNARLVRTGKRLERLLGDFRFAPAWTVLKMHSEFIPRSSPR